MSSPAAAMDLYWLPLGAGGHSVRWNGRVYEAVSALLERRATSARTTQRSRFECLRTRG